ncbi:hypothetical protein IFM89_001889 [Coptis chinensis]|uniref:PI4-kinase N-terminal domain-containing protein n=1 Tax=Coptis chinensis TaxID=261450 RepID=A0A835M3P6_9MAGN|nr:hypothetical protein IFM89_001889 [Coptis chinensis]
MREAGFLGYIVKASQLFSDFAEEVAGFVCEIVINVVHFVNSSEDVGIGIGGNEIISNVSRFSSNSVLREVETPSSSGASVNGSRGFKEGLDSLEKQAIALRLIGHTVDKVPIKHELLDQVRMVSKKQLQSLLIFLKIRKHDWAEDGAMLKARITFKLSVYQAAALVQIKSLASFDLDGKSSKKILLEILALLGVAKIVVTCGGQLLRVFLIRLKPLVLAACAQAYTWGGSEGSMFGSVIRMSCEIIEYGWNKTESLPAGFLLIASGLSSSKLRLDYRHRLLSLCSDLGLAAESKSGR